MEFNAEQVLIYILVGYLLIQSVLIRKDAKESVQSIGSILHQFQGDSKEREEDIWKRANVELQVKNKQLQEAHRFVLRAKGHSPPAQVQPDLPFGMTQNNRPTAPQRRREGIPDAATML